MSTTHSIPEIQLFFSKFDLENPRSRSQSGSNFLMTHIHSALCLSANPFLWHRFFKTWPWKSKVKIIAQGHFKSKSENLVAPQPQILLPRTIGSMNLLTLQVLVPKYTYTGPILKSLPCLQKSSLLTVLGHQQTRCSLTHRLRQNSRHFPDDIFKWISLNENEWILIEISLKFLPKGPINNVPA